MRCLVIMFLLPVFAFTQTWPKVYWKDQATINLDLHETYDKGYILVNNFNSGGVLLRWTWIVKTDINGEILWEKIIGDGIHVTALNDIYQTDDGGYILSGSTTLLDSQHGDTFIMRLNSCGEKEWCKIFYKAGPTTAYDFGRNTYPVPGEDGYISLVGQWGNEFVPGIFKGIWLFRIDNSGNLIWIKNVFDQVDPYAWNEIPHHMFISQDTNCIITAYTGYTDFGGGGVYSKPFVMAAGMDGSEKWWIIDGANSLFYGNVERSTEDSFGNILSVGDGVYQGVGGPLLLKTDKYGNQIYRKLIIDSVEMGKAMCLNILNDTIYDIAGGWTYPGQPSYAAIARTNSSGNLILEKNVLETEFVLYNSIKTFDNKELFIGSITEGIYEKVCLHKFNFDLEYDSVYTQAFEYDYKCSDLPIVSDTIGITDCDVWTALPGEIEYHSAKNLVVYPNPAENEITIQLPEATADEHQWGPMTSRQYNYRYHENSVLKIFDILGRLIEEISLRDIEGNELIKDVTGYKCGIYLIDLFENPNLMASGKFLKK